ncbi:AAA family ATPase [Anaerosphaera multitolerans]|uniref:AAA family ATPase n=1 Tax=Anaerosphaera multitolerans TaxID=2487351 RepID=UPI00196AD6E7|nr:AAA family ATPase [Anaerosphaera multitolerans]
MKQRLVFARSLLNNPNYLFLDEPTAGLDPTLGSRISELILKEKEKGKVIFLTTHNMKLADKICDRVAFLENGRIRAIDTPYNLKLQYGKRVAKITYHNKRKQEEIYDLDKERKELSSIILNENIETIHTGEATLEDIFIKITGRGLS